jgi:hypothetical protein
MFLGEWLQHAIISHCEERSDEAIQLPLCGQMDCFASLAMTAASERAVLRRDDFLALFAEAFDA